MMLPNYSTFDAKNISYVYIICLYYVCIERIMIKIEIIYEFC